VTSKTGNIIVNVFLAVVISIATLLILSLLTIVMFPGIVNHFIHG
jgi:hypothetical protein